MNHLIKVDPNSPISEYVRLCYPGFVILEIALCRKSSNVRFVKLQNTETKGIETIAVELYF